MDINSEMMKRLTKHTHHSDDIVYFKRVFKNFVANWLQMLQMLHISKLVCGIGGMADALALGASEATHISSSLISRTKISDKTNNFLVLFFFL